MEAVRTAFAIIQPYTDKRDRLETAIVVCEHRDGRRRPLRNSSGWPSACTALAWPQMSSRCWWWMRSAGRWCAGTETLTVRRDPLQLLVYDNTGALVITAR